VVTGVVGTTMAAVVAAGVAITAVTDKTKAVVHGKNRFATEMHFFGMDWPFTPRRLF